MSVGLNPRINYATVLGVASEHGRTSSTVVPSGPSVYTSANRQKVEFLIPPISYMDAAASYLRFKLSATATSNVATNAAIQWVAMDNAPALAVWESATLYNAENAVITEVRDVAQLGLHKIRSKGSEYAATVAKNAMGYSTVFDTQPDTTLSAADTVLAAAALNQAGGALNEFPILLTNPPSTAGAFTTSGFTSSEVEVAVPLEYFSGVFSPAGARYLPLKHIGNRAHALRLDLTLNPAAVAMIAFSSGSIAAASDITVNYTISNPEIVVEYTNVGEEEDARIKDAIYTSGLHLLYDDWTTRVDQQWQSGATSYSNQVPKYTISLKDVVCQFRDNSKLSDVRAACISGMRKFGMTSIQAKVGAMFYPNAPVQLPSGSWNGSAYLEWAKASGALNSNTHQAWAPSFSDPSTKAGFELALDFDRKEKDSTEENFTFTGKDTRTGSSQIQLLFTRAAPATESIAITTLFHTDNVLVLERGMAYPLERS